MEEGQAILTHTARYEPISVLISLLNCDCCVSVKQSADDFSMLPAWKASCNAGTAGGGL